MELLIKNNQLIVGNESFRCATGRNGLSKNKKEGDGCTPVGTFSFREVFYRADKIVKPICQLPIRELTKSDCWCDDPKDSNYNRFVMLPYAASHEELWRKDDVYDVIVVIGYNDRPIHPGAGSAIFMHVTEGDYLATSGCVSLALDDLLKVVSNLTLQSTIRIEQAAEHPVEQISQKVER